MHLEFGTCNSWFTPTGQEFAQWGMCLPYCWDTLTACSVQWRRQRQSQLLPQAAYAFSPSIILGRLVCSQVSLQLHGQVMHSLPLEWNSRN